MTPDRDVEVLTVEEVAGLLRISKRAVYRLVHRGLPCTRVLRKLRFFRDQVLAWVRDQTGAQALPAAGRRSSSTVQVIPPVDWGARRKKGERRVGDRH